MVASVQKYIDSIPSLDELRTSLAKCLREADLLRKLIRLAEQRRRVLQATDNEGNSGNG